MLARFIADMYETAVEVILWPVLMLGALIGYVSQDDWAGALEGIVGRFLFDLIFFGGSRAS